MRNENKNGVILFDGICNFCNASVQFVLRRDKNAYFQFASLQSEKGKQLLQEFGLDPAGINSIVLIENNEAFTSSDAVLRIAKHLNSPWNWFSFFKFIPKNLRDRIYSLVADDRYKWFGKREVCMLFPEEWKSRFIE